MKKLLLNRYVLFILVLLLGIGIGFTNRPTQPINTQQSKIEYVDSVVYVPKPYPVVVYKTKTIPVPYEVTVVTKDNETLTKRKYKDVIHYGDSLSVSYDAYVTGTLDSLSLGVIDSRPDKVVYKTQEIQISKPNNGFYIGATVTPTALIPGVQFHAEKNIIGVGFNVATKFPQLSYHRRLF
jgi:hypothetical protein